MGLLEVICIPIPFIFYRYGAKIREKSTLIRSMREDREKADRKRQRAEDKIRRRADAEANAGAAMETGAAIDEQIDMEKGALNSASERSDSEKGTKA